MMLSLVGMSTIKGTLVVDERGTVHAHRIKENKSTSQQETGMHLRKKFSSYQDWEQNSHSLYASQ
jgi:hypothetical protein